MNQQRIRRQADQRRDKHYCRGTDLNCHNTPIVRRANAAVAQSVMERCPRTITAPVMAPIAAAVTPSTKATTPR